MRIAPQPESNGKAAINLALKPLWPMLTKGPSVTPLVTQAHLPFQGDLLYVMPLLKSLIVHLHHFLSDCILQ